MLPITTIIGLQTGLLLSGAVLTETVFAYPGMGSWLASAIFNRDYPVLQGGILFLAVVFVLVNLLVDISYALINPRIRYSPVEPMSIAELEGRQLELERRAASGRDAFRRIAATRARSSAWSSSASSSSPRSSPRCSRPTAPARRTCCSW